MQHADSEPFRQPVNLREVTVSSELINNLITDQINKPYFKYKKGLY
jgi:hypothetical protein